MKILFFASNPDDVTPLNLDEEIRAIKTKIYATKFRDVLELTSRWAVRPDDLLQELLENKPTVVHFSGHGSASGELVLMDDSRKTKTVSPAALKALFSTLKDNIEVVVLNACYSKKQGIAIAEVIDCVIGMNSSIGDQAAINFAASFYRAIGFGRSLKEAFEQGKVSLMLEGIPEENTPELLHRPTIDPATIYLVHKRKSKTPRNKVFELNKEEMISQDQLSINNLAEKYKLQGSGQIKWNDRRFGHFIDPRDQHKYSIVKIGNQIWMAEDLEYSLSGSDPGNSKTTFYTWQDAIASCPQGWHLPSNKDWRELIFYLGGEDIAGGKMKFNGTTPIKKLRNDPSIDDFGFDAMAFFDVSSLMNKYTMINTCFWSSTEFDSNSAWYLELFATSQAACLNHFEKSHLLRVRYIRD